MKRFPQFPVLGIVDVSSNTPRHRNSTTELLSAPSHPSRHKGEEGIQGITTTGVRAKECLENSCCSSLSPTSPLCPISSHSSLESLLGKERRCLQLPGLERIPGLRICWKCCCSSPTAFHYRQVTLFLFPELYLLYFLNSRQRGEKIRSFWCIMIQTLTPDRQSNPD